MVFHAELPSARIVEGDLVENGAYRVRVRSQVFLKPRRGIVVEIGECFAVGVSELFEEHFQALCLVRDRIADPFHVGAQKRQEHFAILLQERSSGVDAAA